MKKLLLFFISFTLTLALAGQVTDHRDGRMAYRIADKSFASKGTAAVAEKIDSVITENWSGSAWIFSSRKKYTYTKNGSTTTQIVQKRDASTAFQWANSTKSETTVNTAGEITLLISYNWSGGQWVPSTKFEAAFNVSGLPTMDAMYTWVASAWMGISKTEYFYSGSDISYDISYTWDILAAPPAWVQSSKSEYTYSAGRIVKEEDYDWDKTLAVPAWVKNEKYEFTYDGAGNIIKEENYTWDATLPVPDYVKAYKTESSYDGHRNNIMQVGYEWDASLSTPAWVYSDKLEYTWDASDRNTMFAFYNWDKNIPGWVGFMKTETSYGSVPVSYSISVSYGWASSAWINSARTTTYYSASSTSVSELREKQQVLAYPNPATEYIRFTGPLSDGNARVVIYDARGRRVIDRLLPVDGTISTSGLKKGIYIFSITGPGKTDKGKFIVK